MCGDRGPYQTGTLQYRLDNETYICIARASTNIGPKMHWRKPFTLQFISGTMNVC